MRLPAGADSLRRAGWAGLQDGMPRAALLSGAERAAVESEAESLPIPGARGRIGVAWTPALG